MTSFWCFKVFEVNASSQRSGRLILSQLKEATQSHQVDSQGVNAHKPTYFNSYGTSNSTGTLRPGSSPSMYPAGIESTVSIEVLVCERVWFVSVWICMLYEYNKMSTNFISIHPPGKLNSPRKVVSSPRKHPQSPRGGKRGGLAPTSLTNFFKMGRPVRETPNTKKNEQIGKYTVITYVMM